MDGCGVLHPARCGSASHVGVVCGLPTVGVAKNLLVVDGLDKGQVEAAAEALTGKGAPVGASSDAGSGDDGGAQLQGEGQASTGSAESVGLDAAAARGGRRALPLVGASGTLWGAALCSPSSKRPLYVSVGEWGAWVLGLCLLVSLPWVAQYACGGA